jgi:hypothetical protein
VLFVPTLCPLWFNDLRIKHKVHRGKQRTQSNFLDSLNYIKSILFQVFA